MQWFRRLADTPGLSYEGSHMVDRRRLTGHDFEPEVLEFELECESRLALEWPTPDGDSEGTRRGRNTFYRRGA